MCDKRNEKKKNRKHPLKPRIKHCSNQGKIEVCRTKNEAEYAKKDLSESGCSLWSNNDGDGRLLLLGEESREDAMGPLLLDGLCANR